MKLISLTDVSFWSNIVSVIVGAVLTFLAAMIQQYFLNKREDKKNKKRQDREDTEKAKSEKLEYIKNQRIWLHKLLKMTEEVEQHYYNLKVDETVRCDNRLKDGEKLEKNIAKSSILFKQFNVELLNLGNVFLEKGFVKSKVELGISDEGNIPFYIKPMPEEQEKSDKGYKHARENKANNDKLLNSAIQGKIKDIEGIIITLIGEINTNLDYTERKEGTSGNRNFGPESAHNITVMDHYEGKLIELIKAYVSMKERALNKL